jgi:peptide/nickel transport system permease protein
MLNYLITRIGQALLVLWAAFTVSFILLQALPGDAILIKFQSSDLGLSAQQIAEIRASYGADSPVWQQYLHAIGNFLIGDLGYSVQAGVPVAEQLATSLPGLGARRHGAIADPRSARRAAKGLWPHLPFRLA